MRRLVVGTFLTLDGVMQAPGGLGEDTEGGFEHDGWSAPLWDDMMHEVVPKYVASTTLDRVEWNNSSLIEGDVPEEVKRLKDQAGTEIQVAGSQQLIQTLLEHDLIDEYRLWVFPVVLGTGKRLFADGSLPAKLNLVDTKPSSTGIAIHTYQAAGKPEYGSFALEE
jgi:dihydrofolate reductase